MTSPWWLNIIWVLGIFCDGLNFEDAHKRGKKGEALFWLLMAMCLMASVICYCYTHSI